MEISAIDFTSWGLDADWPALRWAEPIYSRRGGPLRGVRLGHASDSAMVLTCSYHRGRFDQDVRATGSDSVRELAYETTYAQVSLALHQLTRKAARPDGLVGSLVRYAMHRADRHQEWPRASWDGGTASVTSLASWQSGFSLAYRDAYVVVHACGTGIDGLELAAAYDLSGYEFSSDSRDSMHWELWSHRPDLDYDDLAPALVTL